MFFHIFLDIFFGLLYTSVFEWLLHKYVMHREFKVFRHAFHAHAKVHHHIFKADTTYHLQKESDKRTIPMAWWNGPALVVIATTLVFPIWMYFGGIQSVITLAIILACYYGTYEYLHWCMHLPKERIVEKSPIFRWIFRRLNGHHLLHHRYMHKNFNVVLPVADLLLGTLLVRSKTRFAQATGPSVPDVQPKDPD